MPGFQIEALESPLDSLQSGMTNPCFPAAKRADSAFNMVRERELPLIARGDFGLTQEDVTEAIQEVNASVTGFQESRDDPDYKPGTNTKFYEEFLRRQQNLTANPPEVILSYLRGIYDRTQILCRKGYSPSRAVPKLIGEFPDINLYYPILRKQTWGYKLGSRVQEVLHDRISRT